MYFNADNDLWLVVILDGIAQQVHQYLLQCYARGMNVFVLTVKHDRSVGGHMQQLCYFFNNAVDANVFFPNPIYIFKYK